APVERVHDRADDERDAAEEEEVFPHERRRRHVEREPGDGDRVGRQARLDQAVANQFAAFACPDRRARARPGARPHPAGAPRRCVLPRRQLRPAQEALVTLAAGTREKRHAPGRVRASQLAPPAEAAAVRAPSSASRMKWLAVTTITNTITNGYMIQATRPAGRCARRASGHAIISATATCIEGTADKG